MFRVYANKFDIARLRSKVKACKSLKQQHIAGLCGEHPVTMYLKLSGKRKMLIEQYNFIERMLSEAAE